MAIDRPARMLSFAMASQFDPSYAAVDRTLLQPCSAPALKAFEFKMDMVRELSNALIDNTYYTGLFERAMAIARFEAGIPVHQIHADHELDRFNLHYAVLLHAEDGPGQTAANDRWNRGANVVEAMAATHGTGTVAGCEAILLSCVVQIWAAFEAFCADLWVDSVNSHPDLFGKNFSKNNQDKSFDLATLQRFDFDISRHLGTIALERGKVSFQSLDSIRNCLGSTFGKQISDTLAQDRDLRLAEKLRHLFAHRSGVIDKKFADEVDGLLPHHQTRIGEMFWIDGDIVKRCGDACVRTAVALSIEVSRMARAAS